MMWRGVPLVSLTAALLGGGAAGTLSAQGPIPEAPIDRVVAVVGNSVITYTQVQEEYFARLREQGREPPTDDARITVELEALVDTLIDADLLFQQALRDTTVKVAPLEVSDAVDENVRNIRKGFPSETAFAAELRKAGFLGIDDYRRWLTDRQYKDMMRELFRRRLQERGQIDPIEPTEREVRAFYDANLDRLPRRPPTRSVRQIVIAPKPDTVAKMRAKALADSLVTALRDGADFAATAKRFSQDPVSAAQGGDLGWVRKGVMVREFERASFALTLGAISPPVESPFGYHIIQVERIQPTERKIRHILLSAPIDSAGAARAHALADSVRALIVAGVPFDSLQGIYHDPSELRDARALELGPPLQQVYIQMLTPADSGTLTPVFELPVGAPNANKYAIVKVTAAAPEGPPPFDRMRETLRKTLAERNGLEHYMKQLRQKAYIDKREL